jgi:hypothetical protein
MGFLSKLVGGGITEAAQGIAGVVDQFMETPDEKRAAEIVFRKIGHEENRFQTEINKVEAGHRNVFVAGWRPAIGWICAFALLWGWVIVPFIQFLYPNRPYPMIDTGQAIALVMALLGVGGLRTYEKGKGLTS